MSPRHRAPVAVSLVAASLVAVALTRGCKVYDSSLLVPAADVSGNDGGAGSDGVGGQGGGSGIDAGDGFGFWSRSVTTSYGECQSAGVPGPADRPPAADATALDPIYFGITKLFLGSQNKQGASDMDAWKTIGFDLDGTCTNTKTCGDGTEPAQVSCKSKTSQVPFDGDYCRDNTFGRFEFFVAGIPEIGSKYRLNDNDFNCGLCLGTFNFLIKLSRYNGMADDDDVRIDTYPSPGLEQPILTDCSQVNLCWLPNMPWLIEDDSMQNPAPGPALPDGKLFDDHAYVRDGYVVVSLPDDALFWFPTAPGASTNTFPVKLQKSVIVAKIVRAQDGTWSLVDGTIAGRMKGTDIVQSFRSVGLCDCDPNYTLMQNYVAANNDILSNGMVDPTMPCDSISVGLEFTAQEATAGKLQKVTPLEPCAGSGGSGGCGGAGGSSGSGGSGAAGGSSGSGGSGG